MSFVRRFLVIAPSTLLAAAATLLATPVGAQAGLLGSLVNLSACSSATESQPFLRWLDPLHYELVPGGANPSSWSVSGGASLVPGAEPWGVAGSVSSSSLSLPAGSSAQSPTTCDDAAYPIVRFFIAGTGVVAVSVVDGNLVIPAGFAIGLGAWTPSLPSVTLSAVTGLLSGGTSQVALRFTSIAGNPKISDVFIDPWRTW